MATHRNRYVKVALFEASSANLMGGTIVGQSLEWLLVERPQPKPRVAARKPRARKANAKGHLPSSPNEVIQAHLARHISESAV